MNTYIISAFPACGKTYCFENYQDKFKMLDSDSSQFSWIKDENGKNKKERNPEFPNNYIKHIKENIGKVDIIFVSSHDVVRKALKENNIPYIIVYPHNWLREEFLHRYKERGNNETFINMIDKNWNTFISEINSDSYPTKIRLNSNEHLKDIFIKTYCPTYSDLCTVDKTNADEYEGNPCTRCYKKDTILDYLNNKK